VCAAARAGDRAWIVPVRARDRVRNVPARAGDRACIASVRAGDRVRNGAAGMGDRACIAADRAGDRACVVAANVQQQISGGECPTKSSHDSVPEDLRGIPPECPSPSPPEPP
jgi:hypothetical protein